MWYEIYVHVSPSGKKYVGITSEDSYTRWTKHCRKARFGSNTNFHKAIRKYGESNWSHDILDTFFTTDKKYAYSKEQGWINKISPEYNMECAWNIVDRRGDKNPMFGKISGNANPCSIEGTTFDSVTQAATKLGVNRATIQRWIKSKRSCFML